MTNGVWDQNGLPGSGLASAVGRPPKALTLSLVAAIVLAAAVVSGGTTVAPRSDSPAPTLAPDTPANFGQTLGAFSYPTFDGTAIAAVDTKGNVRFCVQGSPALQLWAVTSRWILYSDPQLMKVAVDCKGAPALVGGRGVVRTEDDGYVACASVRPRGDLVRLSAYAKGEPRSYVATLDGGTWRAAGDSATCTWVNDDYIVHDGYDAYAVSLEGGTRFLRHPEMWADGSRSPDGKWAIYQTSDPLFSSNPPRTVFLDRRRGPELEIDTGRGSLGDLHGQYPSRQWRTQWSAAGRFISLLDSGDILVYDATRSEETLFPVHEFRSPLDHPIDPTLVSAGWFDDERLWYFGEGALWLVDGSSGDATRLAAPRILANADPERGLAFFLPITEPSTGIGSGELLSGGDLRVEHRDGVTFRALPTWSVGDSCDGCSVGPYAMTFAVSNRTVCYCEGPGPAMIVARTRDSVRTAIAKVRDSFGEDGLEFSTHAGRLGGRAATVASVQQYDYSQNFTFVRVGSVTYIVAADPGLDDDPTARAMFGSIRFG